MKTSRQIIRQMIDDGDMPPYCNEADCNSRYNAHRHIKPEQSSDFTVAMLATLQSQFGQYAKYWRYVPVKGVPEWQCSVDGENWWAASERTVLA